MKKRGNKKILKKGYCYFEYSEVQCQDDNEKLTLKKLQLIIKTALEVVPMPRVHMLKKKKKKAPIFLRPFFNIFYLNLIFLRYHIKYSKWWTEI